MAKGIPLNQLALLRKLLAMTTSANDAEALVAVRKANAIMKTHAFTWDDLFARTVTVDAAEPEPEAPSEAALRDKINESFDYLRGRDLGNFTDFIESIEKQWLGKKYLTPGQRKPLFDAVEMAKDKERRQQDKRRR